MGSFWSRSLKERVNVSGNNNTVWMFNGVNFDISSMLDHSIQNVVERFQDVLIKNNPIIIINIMLMLTIIILPIMFLYLRHRYQQFPPLINLNTYPLNNSVGSSTYNNKYLSKNIPSISGEYIV